VAKLKLAKQERLREMVDKCERLSVIEVGAPELGDGCTAYARELTLDEMAQVRAIQHDSSISAADRYKILLAVCAAEADGTPAFTAANDPAIGKMPLRLANRIIAAATDE